MFLQEKLDVYIRDLFYVTGFINLRTTVSLSHHLTTVRLPVRHTRKLNSHDPD